LIGTNDADCELSEANLKFKMREMKLPRRPDAEWYEENLRLMVQRLKQDTQAHIVLLSIPTIGEDIDNFMFAVSKKYANISKKVAKDLNIDYLPLNERMVEYSQKNEANPRFSPHAQRKLMILALIANKFGVSYKKISNWLGFDLHMDFLHLNHKGASLVADLIFDYIRKLDIKY
jgi:lysophospholipase L1-like esterase